MTEHFPDPREMEGITRFLTGLGDPSRLKILFFLGNKGRHNVGEIAAANSQISRSAISHHLKILKDAGIVYHEKIGQEVYYWLAQENVINTLRSLADMAESFTCGD